MNNEFDDFSKEVIAFTQPRRAKRVDEISKDDVKQSSVIEPKKQKETMRERFIRFLLKKHGLKELPSLEQLFEGRNGLRMKIKDIGIFISDNPGNDCEIIKNLAIELPLRNTINLSAEVSFSQIKHVLNQILEAGKVWMGIEVAKLKDGSKNYEAWSGRHRLAGIALLYGADAEVPVEVRELTTLEARDAVIYANKSRKVRGLEKAEHNALRFAKGGIEDFDRNVLYEQMVKSKGSAVQFAIISTVTKNSIGVNILFPITKTASRSGGCFTTIDNLGSYFKAATRWDRKNKISREEFDYRLKNAVVFLNNVVSASRMMEKFDPKQAMANKPLVALGNVYLWLLDKHEKSKVEPVVYAEAIAKIIVELGSIGREKSEELTKKIKKNLIEMTNG